MQYLVLREQGTPTVAGRILTGRIATYNRIYQPTPTLRERILPGAFRAPKARPAGVVRYRHAGERPGEADDLDHVHGLVIALREEGDAVLADLELFDGPAGDKLIRLVDSGAIDGLSMSAVVADSARARDGVVDIRRISQLNGVSLTPAPAYDDARVLALREAQEATRRERIAAERAAWGLLLTSPGR